MIYNDHHILGVTLSGDEEEFLFLKFCALSKVIPEFGKTSRTYNVVYDDLSAYNKAKESLETFMKTKGSRS